VRGRELAGIHLLAARSERVKCIPRGVTDLIGLGDIERQQRSGAEKPHRNHLGSHFEHAVVLLIRLFLRGRGRRRFEPATRFGAVR
jgi:hypothetical protein